MFLKGNNQLTHQQMSLGAVFKVGGSGSVHLGNKTNKWQQNKQMAAS